MWWGMGYRRRYGKPSRVRGKLRIVKIVYVPLSGLTGSARRKIARHDGTPISAEEVLL